MKYNVNGDYPMMANWLIVKRTGIRGEYIINNVLSDESFEVDRETLDFLRHLDGNTNPYDLGERYDVDVDSLMDWLLENMLLRTEGRKWLSDGGMSLTTWYIPKKKRTNSIIPKLYNFLLVVGWLPMFCFGIYRMISADYDLNSDYMLLGYFLSLAAGLFFHELSHAMACLAHGGYFMEMGTMWHYVFPGAYVLIDKSNIKSKLKRVNVDIAGVMANMMIAGIFMALIPCFETLSGCFLMVALNNIMLTMFNLTFISGLDGSSIIEEVLGIENGMEQIKSVLINGLFNKKWYKLSANRRAETMVCGVLLIYQILMPIVVINNILIIIGGFF